MAIQKKHQLSVYLRVKVNMGTRSAPKANMMTESQGPGFFSRNRGLEKLEIMKELGSNEQTPAVTSRVRFNRKAK